MPQFTRNNLIYISFFLLSIFTSQANSTHKSPFISVKILGINDFHGQISSGRFFKNQPVGGAAVLAAYLKQAQLGLEEQTLITIMGDQVGASPPSSGLLHDEPSIIFTNTLGNSHCNQTNRLDPQCNIVATVGNHEFDKGQRAMLDLIYGTDKPPTDNWIALPNYPGASYPYISANIVDAKTHKPVFPPYVIKKVKGIRIAFIGAVLKNAADSMFPANAEGIEFLDEVESINQYIPEVKEQGATAIVVIMHEGGNQIPYEGDTKTSTQVEGSINAIVQDLDDDIDVVMGGHTHQFLNAYLSNKNGKSMLVTQANSYSSSFADVTLRIDPTTGKVAQKSARIVNTFANRWPGTVPDEQALQIVSLAENTVAPKINSYVGTLQNEVSRKENADGECTIGNLIADALKSEMNTEIGLTNPHGLRDDLRPGIISWGQIYSVLPFSNNILTVTLSGEDIYALLEQQWMGSYSNMLQISGITYTYDPSKPVGKRIVKIMHHDKPLNKLHTYTIATPDFLATGGGIFSVMKRSKLIKIGENDHDTLVNYIKKLPQPFAVEIEGRIKRIS